MTINQGSAILIATVTAALTARALGPNGRGTVAVALGFATILVQVGNLGVTSANAYFVSRDPGRTAKVITNTVWLASAIGIALVVAGLAARNIAPQTVRGVTSTELAIALATIPAQLAAGFFQSILFGHGRTLAFNSIALVANAGYLLSICVGVAVLHLGVAGVLGLTLARSGAIALASLSALAARTDVRFRRPDIRLMRDMLAYGFRIYVALLLQFLLIRGDLLLVNVYLGTREAGYYSIAAVFAETLCVVPTIVAANLFLRVARGSETAASALVFRTVAACYAVVCLVGICLTTLAVNVVYGAEFAPSATLVYWLFPGIFSLGMLTILSQHFAGRGFPLGAVLVWFAGLGVNLVMNLFLLPVAGTYIAALSSSVAYTLVLILHVRMFAAEAGSYRSLLPRPRETLALLRGAVAARRVRPAEA